MKDSTRTGKKKSRHAGSGPSAAGGRFMLRWTLFVGVAYTVSVLIGGYLILMASILLHCTGFSALVDTCSEGIFPERLPYAIGLTMAAGAFFGLVAGTTQWLIIRRRLATGIRWLGFSFAASILTFPIFLLFFNLVTDEPVVTLLLILTAAAFIGLIVGLAQWLVLKTGYDKARLWIPLTALCGLLLAGPVVGPLFVSATADQPLETGPGAGFDLYGLLIIFAAAAMQSAGLMLIQKRST